MENTQPLAENTAPQMENQGFSGLGIAPKMLEILANKKFVQPTPIQQRCIPSAIEGKDLIGIAQTGTGKTLAFVIPLLQRLAQMNNGSTGLILVPTRELALQVEETISNIGGPLGVKTAVVIGGASMYAQTLQLRRNPNIIIATPGRLIDHLSQKTVNLGPVRVLILDEADRMLDMGFAPQLDKILPLLKKEKQVLLFSATMPDQIVIFSHLISQRVKETKKKALILAHREELLLQAKDKLQRINPALRIGIEQAEHTADHVNDEVVIASVATIGRGDRSRLFTFDPQEYATIIIDEAHHASAESYKTVLNHFGVLKGQNNSNRTILLLGVTATPKRNDNQGIDQIFDDVSYTYNIIDGMQDGYDADVTIIDPDKEWEVRVEDFRSKSKNSPFIGRKLRGRVEMTICGGKITYQV
jgi:superfamily II DNA/RNA helicase